MKLYISIITVLFLFIISTSLLSADEAGKTGLLFYLSGESHGDGFTADFAKGDPEPAYLNEYTIIPDGAKGSGFSAPHSQEKLMAYLAPGNIYAERGTVSFFWRSRDPVGGMPFKLFQVSYCDHSSLDMTWLRIDYNGNGFDAFVTDENMARVRVSYRIPVMPEPEKWTHFAFTWDETRGVRLYINNSLVAQKDTTAVFYAGLGLFCPHGRFANPGTVTANCGHMRGGDIDEIYIYDRMLSPENVARLAQGESPDSIPSVVRNLSDPVYRDEWWYRYGWNRSDDISPYLPGKTVSVRKVEIHDAYDQKKWVWRSNDGIRETTWPNVYNRSLLPGRSDYFIEPDWYCYSTSGKSITYTLPEEPWNYLEISGAAYGTVSRISLDKESQRETAEVLFKRPAGQERTFHSINNSFQGGKIRFNNDVRETPLGELSAYNVSAGREPEGIVKLTYNLTGKAEPDNLNLTELVDYINKRFLPDERQIMVGLPRRAPRNPKVSKVKNPLPLVHILIPFEFRNEGPRTNAGAYAGFHYNWENILCGLDGIAIDIPALDVKPTHGEFFPLNIQIKDPVWPNRNMIDFSFSVKPGEPKTLWLDTRDRILPNGRSFYITIAGAGSDFGPDSLEGAQVRLIFKDRKEAISEHEIDRFTQVRDNFAGNMSETGPQRKKLEHLARFNRDITDLFQVNPYHIPGRYYWCRRNSEQGWPAFEQPKAPAGIPLWAFRQTEILGQWRYFINWWIDNRQIENGEFGGGLSDDGDFANCMPGLALMGVDPEKITDSIHRLMESYYENGMFTNGLNTILTDALHASEEGTNVQPEVMLLEYGDPKIVERILKTSSRYVDVTGINSAGHRHFPSSFFSSTKMATENPWCWSAGFSLNILYPGMVLVEYNGHPTVKKLMQEIGDGYLAHAKKDAKGNITLPSEINFITDEDRRFSRGTASQLLQTLAQWTGDNKYISHLGDFSRSTSQTTVNKKRLEDTYARTIQYNSQNLYIATDGFPWDDGPYLNYGGIQESRLGGSPIRRGRQFPNHVVSWKFEEPATAESVAILIPESTRKSFKLIVYNLEIIPVTTVMTGWIIDPGTWEVVEGIDDDGDDKPDTITQKRTVEFERSKDIKLVFSPGKTTIVQLTLKKKGTPYWKRPDLGIGKDDISVQGNRVRVTVHSLGSVNASAGTVTITDSSGTALASASISALGAPLDYVPKTTDVTVSVPTGTNLSGCSVVINQDNDFEEITRLNNTVIIP